MGVLLGNLDRPKPSACSEIDNARACWWVGNAVECLVPCNRDHVVENVKSVLFLLLILSA